jgi:hypothetical protein
MSEQLKSDTSMPSPNEANATQLKSDASQPEHSISMSGMLLGCLLGAALSFALLAVIDNSIRLTEELPNQPSDSQLEKYNAIVHVFNFRKSAISIGSLGLLMGVFAGAFGASKRFMAGLLGGVLGAFGGTVAGVLTSNCVEYFNTFRDVPPVILGITLEPLTQGAICTALCWAITGAAIGLGICIAQGGIRLGFHGLFGGVWGGLAATAICTLLFAVVFPNSELITVVPAPTAERIIWILVGSLCVGFLIASSTRSKPITVAP